MLIYYYYIQIQIVVENKLFTFELFIGNVGGYLGLLLGASILSLFDQLCEVIEHLFERKMNRF
jgi:hypothetical protein